VSIITINNNISLCINHVKIMLKLFLQKDNVDLYNGNKFLVFFFIKKFLFVYTFYVSFLFLFILVFLLIIYLFFG